MAASPKEAYDGLGGHSKVDEFPIPSSNCKPVQRKLKSVSILKTKKKVPVTHTLHRFLDLT